MYGIKCLGMVIRSTLIPAILKQAMTHRCLYGLRIAVKVAWGETMIQMLELRVLSMDYMRGIVFSLTMESHISSFSMGMAETREIILYRSVTKLSGHQHQHQRRHRHLLSIPALSHQPPPPTPPVRFQLDTQALHPVNLPA